MSNLKKVGNGEGSLYYSEKLSKWIYQYWASGKRKTLKQKKNETVKDFKKKVTELKNNINIGTYIEKNNKILIEIMREHVQIKYETNEVSARTYIRDLQTIKQIEKTCKDIIHMPIQKITSNHIKRILPNMTKYSNNTIVKMYRLLNKTFKIAVSDNIILSNPMDNISIKRPKSRKKDKTVEALTIEENKKLLEVLLNNEHKYKYIILLQLYTGMRIGEVLALSTKDIDYKEGTITIRKTLTRDKNDKVIMGDTTKTENSQRTIIMTKRARAVLQEIQRKQATNINGLIFFDNEKNTYITPLQVNCYLKRLNKKENIAINLHTHMLRHTFATRFLESGGRAKTLQEILGHKKIETTLDIYTSILKEFNKNENEQYDDYIEAQSV